MSTPSEDPAAKPKKVRWYHNLWQAFQLAQRHDPRTGWLLGLILVGTTAVVVLAAGLTIGQWVLGSVLGLSLGALAATLFLGRRLDKAVYAQIEGKPGAAYQALSMIRRGWVFTQEPVALDPRTSDLVFRGIGRPGVLLVSEGPAHRVGRLLEAERKRTARVVGGAPVILVQMGDDEGQVPLRQLGKHVAKLKATLTQAEVGAVEKRLTSLGTMKMPVPKGVDPTKARPDRRGLRGR